MQKKLYFCSLFWVVHPSKNSYSVSVYRGVWEEKSSVLIPYDEESPGSIEHHSG